MVKYIKKEYPLILFFVIIFISLTIFFLSFIFFKVDNTLIKPTLAIELNDGWYTYINGEKHDFNSITRKEACKEHETLTVYYDFDSNSINDATIFLETKNEKVKIYLDNEQLDYEYGYNVTIPFDKELGAVYNIIDLKKDGQWVDTANKQLRIELTPLKSNSKMGEDAYHIFFGSNASIYLKIFYDKLYIMAICIFSFIVGFAFIVFGVISIIRKKHIGTSVIYLGIFVIIAVFWLASDSLLFQFVTPYKYVNYLIFNFSFILLPLPITLFAKEIFYRYRKFFSIMSIILFVYALLRIILYVTATTDFATGLFIEHLLMSVLIVFSFYASIREMIKNKKKYVLFGYTVMLLIDTFSLIYFYANSSLKVLRSGYSSYFFIGIMAFCIIYLICLIYEDTKLRDQAIKSSYYETKAYIDNLTNAKNRAAMENDLDNLEKDKKLTTIAAYLLDLNNLKVTNDKYGHEAGDRLIIDTCNCLKKAFINANIYRIGGDEMVVIATNCTQSESINYLLELEKIIKDYNNEHDIPIHYAIGYTFENNIVNLNGKFTSLIRIADINMYIDKNQKKNLENLKF